MRSQILALFTTLLLMLAVAEVPAQPTGPTQPVDYKADRFDVRTEGNQEVLELVGNVRLVQGDVVITASRAIYYPASKRAVLTGNVVVHQPGTTIYAPRIEYDGLSKLSTAPNGVRIKESDGANIYGTWGQYDISRRRASFRNGVRLEDKQGTLRASSGDYYSTEARAEFRGNVFVDSDSATINARELTYWRTTEQSIAIGDVVVRPKKRDVTLTGDTVRDYPRRDYTIATGSPRLVDIDTANTDAGDPSASDTTIITANVLEAFRSKGSEEYLATGNVRMRRSELLAIGKIARFLPDQDVVGIGNGRSGVVASEIDSTVDSTGVSPSDTVQGAVTGATPPATGSALSAEDLAVVWYGEAQMSGDTITVRLEDDALRTITASGNAFAVDTAQGNERYNQFVGTRLHIDVYQDTVRQVRSEGAASYIYFKYDKDMPDGMNRSSGDTIRIEFDQGDVRRIAVLGPHSRLEGDYFPEPMITGRETQFRLVGFRWFERDKFVAMLDGAVPDSPDSPQVKLPAGANFGEE